MKTVLITGAAHGIGRATARLFASEGWYVGLYDINEAGLATLGDELGAGKCCYSRCDVTDRESIAQALAHFAEHTEGQLHVLVNNAGVLSAGPFEAIEVSAHSAIIDVNIKGMTHVAQQAFSLLKQTAGATVVNLSSVSSIYAIPQLAVYSASKYYVSGFTKALNIEWEEHDIHVLCVKPPVVKTAMGESLPEHMNRRMASDMTPEYVAQAIFQATQGGRRMVYVLGFKSRLWAFMCKLLPKSGQRSLTRWLASHDQRDSII